MKSKGSDLSPKLLRAPRIADAEFFSSILQQETGFGQRSSPHSYKRAIEEADYLSQVYSQTLPTHLGAVAKLYGLPSVPIEAARVLEIGCACGGNILPLAYNYPSTQFVGIDISDAMLTLGRNLAERLGLNNISLQTRDLMTLGLADGKFDYIIAHGIFSWVSTDHQEALLQVGRNLLSDNGVMYVSYNTFPGVYLKNVVSDALRFHVRNVSDQLTRAESARHFLSSVIDVIPPDDQMLRLQFARRKYFIDSSDNTFFLIDDLSPSSPIYFCDFVSQAQKHGLQYIADADIDAIPAEHEVYEKWKEIDEYATDPITRGQYLDFILGRSFRQSLLCHADKQIHQAPDYSTIRECYILSTVESNNRPRGFFQKRLPTEFKALNGDIFRSEREITRALFAILGEQWPQALHFDTLLDMAMERVLSSHTWARKSVSSSNAAVDLVHDLSYLHTHGGAYFVEFHTTCPPQLTRTPDSHPISSAFARVILEISDKVVNLWHVAQSVSFSDRFLILQMDGTKSIAELAQLLRTNVQQGMQPFSPKNAHQYVVDAVDRFAKSGLLVKQS